LMLFDYTSGKKFALSVSEFKRLKKYFTDIY
jgi:hypothetical protein